MSARRIFLPTAAIVFAVAIPAFAVEHPGTEGPPSSEQWRLLGFAFVNFAIFVFLMYRFARAPLRDFLAGRRAHVVAEMAEAARLKEEAERLKREYEHKAAELDKARHELISEIRSIAEADRERAIAAVELAAQRMRDDVDRTAQSDLERARADLRAEAARLAEDIARDELRRRMGESDQQRLLREFLARVQK